MSGLKQLAAGQGRWAGATPGRAIWPRAGSLRLPPLSTRRSNWSPSPLTNLGMAFTCVYKGGVMRRGGGDKVPRTRRSMNQGRASAAAAATRASVCAQHQPLSSFRLRSRLNPTAHQTVHGARPPACVGSTAGGSGCMLPSQSGSSVPQTACTARTPGSQSMPAARRPSQQARARRGALRQLARGGGAPVRSQTAGARAVRNIPEGSKQVVYMRPCTRAWRGAPCLSPTAG